MLGTHTPSPSLPITAAPHLNGFAYACRVHLLQGALILKILRGKFPPVSGYSPDICDLIKRCLTQVRAASSGA